jgi:hypothetical protein
MLSYENFYPTGRKPNGDYYLSGRCRLCIMQANQSRRKLTNYEVDNKWREKNKSKLNKIRRDKRKNDEQYKKTDNERCKKFRKENKEWMRIYHRDWSNRNKIQVNLRRRFKRAFDRSSPKLKFLVGCDIEFFRNYLQNQFTEGMTWDNYGSFWSIDHRLPISFAKTQEDMDVIFHYTNCRPLELIKNSAKRNKIIPDILTPMLSFENIPSRLLNLLQQALKKDNESLPIS